MKTVWVGKTPEKALKKNLGNFVRYLLVDAVPIIVLLAVMAYGMALLSNKLSEPRSVEIQTIVNKLS